MTRHIKVTMMSVRTADFVILNIILTELYLLGLVYKFQQVLEF